MTAALRLAFWFACCTVAVLSFMPSAYLDAGVFNWWDKAQHALAFLLLGGLGFWAYPDFVFRVLAGLLLYGGVIELVQGALAWRTGDLQDWGGDVVGLCLASLLRYWVLRRSISSQIAR